MANINSDAPYFLELQNGVRKVVTAGNLLSCYLNNTVNKGLVVGYKEITDPVELKRLGYLNS